MKKNSLLLQLLKLLGAFIISWFLMVCIFAASTTGDEIPEKYNLPMVIIAIFLSFAVNIIIDFNAIARLKSAISKSKADIESVTIPRRRLLIKRSALRINTETPKPSFTVNLQGQERAVPKSAQVKILKRLSKATRSLNPMCIRKSF